MINFPFATNGKLIILGVPILKHFTVQDLIIIYQVKKLSHHLDRGLDLTLI